MASPSHKIRAASPCPTSMKCTAKLLSAEVSSNEEVFSVVEDSDAKEELVIAEDSEVSVLFVYFFSAQPKEPISDRLMIKISDFLKSCIMDTFLKERSELHIDGVS